MEKVYVILGSTRQNRAGENVARWVIENAPKRDDIAVELIDLREWPLPYFDEPRPPMMLGGKYSDPRAQKWVEKIAEGDSFVIVTPEYNHGYPAVLKNALDYPYGEWNFKPVAFIGYSGMMSGALRAIEQLRQVAVELKMVPIRETLSVRNARDAFDESGRRIDDSYTEDLDDLFTQLYKWTKVLKNSRAELASD